MDCIEVGQNACRPPKRGDYGVFFVETFKGAGSGGTRINAWFDGKNALLAYMRECALHGYVDEEEDEWQSLVGQVREVVNAVDQGSSSFSESVDALNAAMEDQLCIEWWGPFDELLVSGDLFARGLRAGFRENEGEDPIAEDEVDAFAADIAAQVG